MTIENDLVDFARSSTRPPGKCLGFANNDIVGHFGKLGQEPYSAKLSSNALAAAGLLQHGPLPDRPVVVFYDFVEGGINYGHVDWWLPSLHAHLADSSRCTTWLNERETVGLYASWGGPIIGWADIPAVGAQITVSKNPGAPTPLPAPPGSSTTAGATKEQWAAIQAGLKRRARYAGVVDGVPGPNTWKGVQLSVRSGGGYLGPIDGVPGINTFRAVQRYAHQFGGYAGPIDGVPGFNTWQGFIAGVR